jgi:hypothetical protein
MSKGINLFKELKKVLKKYITKQVIGALVFLQVNI